MTLTPNLSVKARVVYVLFGLGVAGASFIPSLDGWERVVVAVLGAAAIVTGATGW